jgi:hypothetical protein
VAINLLVNVRATGEQALRNLGRQFTRLSNEIGNVRRRNRGALGDMVRDLARLGRAGAAAGVNAIGEGIRRIGNAAMSAAPALGKWAAIIVSIAALAVPLVATIGNLIPLLMLIAPATLTAVAAFSTLKLAFAGVGDALKAGLEGDIEKYTEAMRKLAPAAQETVAKLVALASVWRRIRGDVQQSFFKGAAAELQRLSDAAAPLASRWLPALAEQFRKAAVGISRVVEASIQSGQMERIFASVSRILDGLLSTLAPLSQAFLDIAETAGPTLAGMSKSAGNLAEKFAAWIREAKESGKLKGWLDKAKETLDQLERIAGNVGRMIKAIFTGGQESGEDFLDTLEKLTDKWADWMASPDGQKFVDNLGKISVALVQITALTGSLIGLWSSWAGGIRTIWSIFVNYALFSIGTVLTGLEKLLGWVPGMGGALRKAKSEFDAFAAGATKALNSIPDVHVTVFANVKYRDPGRNVQGNSVYVSGEGGRAAGGPVMAGRTYLVGEQGLPELYTPSRSGYVHSGTETARMLGGRSSSGDVDVAAPVVLQLDTETVWQGLLRFKRRAGKVTLGLA